MIKVVVDFGSSMTKIYMPGCGVVLSEATCIAVEEYAGGAEKLGIKAYGDKAKALSGRAAINTHIVNPVFEGDIVHENLAAHLLSYFLEKIEITPRKARRTELLFILPCGVRNDVKAKYKRMAAECGIGFVYFTLTPIAAVLGHSFSLSESTPVFSLDIGHSLTNIAAFSQDGVIAGLNVNLGGGNIDAHIIDMLAESYDMRVGGLTAERLKNTVGSLLEDDNKMTVVDGREISSGAPASIAVNSGQIYGIITTYIDKVCEYVQLVIAKLPAEVASGVMRGGMYLSGGLMKLDGLAEYIGKKLNIHVNMPEEPQFASVIGGGMIIAEEELCLRLAETDE